MEKQALWMQALTVVDTVGEQSMSRLARLSPITTWNGLPLIVALGVVLAWKKMGSARGKSMRHSRL